MSSFGNLSRPRALKFIEQCGRFCDWNIPAQRMVFWLYDGLWSPIATRFAHVSTRRRDRLRGWAGRTRTRKCRFFEITANSLVFHNILVPETFRVSSAPTPEGSAHDFRTERLCAQIVSGIHPEQHRLALT